MDSSSNNHFFGADFSFFPTFFQLGKSVSPFPFSGLRGNQQGIFRFFRPAKGYIYRTAKCKEPHVVTLASPIRILFYLGKKVKRGNNSLLADSFHRLYLFFRLGKNQEKKKMVTWSLPALHLGPPSAKDRGVSRLKPVAERYRRRSVTKIRKIAFRATWMARAGFRQRGDAPHATVTPLWFLALGDVSVRRIRARHAYHLQATETTGVIRCRAGPRQ